MLNLDLEAAGKAQAIIQEAVVNSQIKSSEVENLVTKALGVVQENGIFAGLLYLYSVKDKDTKIAKPVRTELLKLLPKITTETSATIDAIIAMESAGQTKEAARQALNRIIAVSENLETLLLVKQVWEQTLIYARYGAKTQNE